MHACWDGGMESAQTQGAHINSTGQGTYKGGCRHAWQAMAGGRSRAMHAPADRGAKNLTSNDWPSSSMLESRAACRWQQNAPSTGRQSAVHTQDGKDGGGFGEVAAQRGAGWMPPHRTHPAPPPPQQRRRTCVPPSAAKGSNLVPASSGVLPAAPPAALPPPPPPPVVGATAARAALLLWREVQSEA